RLLHLRRDPGGDVHRSRRIRGDGVELPRLPAQRRRAAGDDRADADRHVRAEPGVAATGRAAGVRDRRAGVDVRGATAADGSAAAGDGRRGLPRVAAAYRRCAGGRAVGAWIRGLRPADFALGEGGTAWTSRGINRAGRWPTYSRTDFLGRNAMTTRAVGPMAGIGWLKNAVNLGRNNPRAVFG